MFEPRISHVTLKLVGKVLQNLIILLLITSFIFLLGLQFKPLGFIPLVLGILLLPFTGKVFMRDLSLLFLAVLILNFIMYPDIYWHHIVPMSVALFSVIFIPYLVSRFVFKDRHVVFSIKHGLGWSRFEAFYFLFVIVVSYLIIPFYLKNTQSYLNWTFDPNWEGIARFYIGINIVGIWDELFFVSFILGILKRYLSFKLANVAQAIAFSSILYEFGFKGWGFAMIFIFALTQGYVLKKTESVLYIIIVHLALDIVLFLALINAHHPDWFPIFITSGI